LLGKLIALIKEKALINSLISASSEAAVVSCTVGLAVIVALVLLLPFLVKKIEQNIEPFFLVMGICAITVSDLWSGGIVGWSKGIVIEALKAPVFIHSFPIGIFQVVLIAGLIIYFFNKPIYRTIAAAVNKLGFRVFIFLCIAIFGLISSIISVIVTAVIISELIAAFPFKHDMAVKVAVVTCFAVGLGAALTPVGEPLSTIAIAKLSGPPYNAGFFFLVDMLGAYIIPGVICIAIFGCFYLSRGLKLGKVEPAQYAEPIKAVVWRAVKVYLFVAGLILLGSGMLPMIIWYVSKVPPYIIYWVNIISAVLDNATLTAAEIGPVLTPLQMKSALMGLLVAGGMLIPGNIPNIVAAGRLKITSKEWAKLGVSIGLVIMVIYFLILYCHMFFG
jgi:predicted cation transporter